MFFSTYFIEHLDRYEKSIQELVRVAKKEVFIVFFIKPNPLNNKDIINKGIDRGYVLYHNEYSKDKLEKFVRSLSRVNVLEWEEVSAQEIVLHIYLK